tara:strand:- start:887 stop:1201 length:315 start_codon:yes stop_codon:yes gene_type:complete
MFLNLAYAQNAQGSGGFLVQLLPLILIFVVFYFLLIRPQQKRVKQHKDMVGALKAGNYVVTSGGIISKVIKIIDDNYIEVDLAKGLIVKLKRDTIVEVLQDYKP